MAEQEEFEKMKKEKEDSKLKKRRDLLQNIMFNKRIPTAKVNEQKKITDFIAQEVQEEIQIEDQVEKGHMDLYQHQKKRKHRSKKRCWICKSFKHLKKSCPQIRCFYCKRLGHVKATCFQRKLNFVFDSLMKDLKKRRQRIELKEEKERTKDEEIKRQIKIFQKRAKELEYGLVKTEKGEIMAAKWNGKIIGKYTGPGLPGPIQSDIAANKFNWGLMDRLVERTAPYDVFTLYDGFLNYCQCGEIDLSKRDFIGHVKDHHRGLIQKGCQLNKPPWLGWILFINDEVEEAFCYSDEDLDESILTNCLI